MLMEISPNMTGMYIAIILAITVPFLILAILHYFYRYRADKVRSDRLMTVIATLALAGILISATYFVIEDRRKEELVTLDYRAVLTTKNTSEGVVWVPVSANSEIQDALRVTKGKGTIVLMETEHGLALRIEYEGDVTVRGSIESFEYFAVWQLTMKRTDWDDRTWAGFDPAPGEVGNVSIKIEVWRDSLYSRVGEGVNAYLVEGWDEYSCVHWERS
jgi:hypothetical protein